MPDWQVELELSKKYQAKWVDRAKKIIKRYRDERQVMDDNFDQKKFNILWSNVRTMLPAIYARKPKAQVERRYKDADPVGRTAAQIMERALQYEIDVYPEFDAAMRASILDRLLPGRGVAWVRYEPHFVNTPDPHDEEKELQEQGTQVTEDAEVTQVVQHETSPVDYVFWEDFRHSPARTWEEVTWVARLVYMAKDEGIERFGKKFEDVPLVHEPIGLDELKTELSANVDSLKKAKVWEIWSKPERKVYWRAEQFPQDLDEKDDPLQLEGFFPCPKPVYATLTSDTLIPVPDYTEYQDQARELDELTQRISMLTKACKVVGVYDASSPAIERMLAEGVDNTLIPVDTWAAFAEKGGTVGAVQFLPLDLVFKTLQQLYISRDSVKQTIYEITGLSDIVRGSSDATETATAQQIKSQFASLRLRETQADVARFASDILRIKAQIMANFYKPETLVAMSGIEQTQDAQYIVPALELLKSQMRTFRIEVASDSLVELDEQAEKESRIEFLTMAGTFLEKAFPLVQMAPAMGPFIGELMLFGVRSFKASRPIEAAFDQMVTQLQQQPAGPNPEELAKQQQAIEQGKKELEDQGMRLKEEKANLALQKVQDQAKLDVERLNLATERKLLENDKAMTKERFAMEQERAGFEQEKATTAQLQEIETAKNKTQEGESVAQVADRVAKVTESQQQALTESATQISQAAEVIAGAAQVLSKAAEQIARPKKRTLQRGPDGRAVAVIEE